MELIRTRFIRAATWHGGLEEAELLLAAHPELASDLHVAAITGDAATVRRLISSDPAAVRATVPPHGADALVHLCLSRYLRLDPGRSDALLTSARALLDAGADPDSGFTTSGPHPERETALYGAAGVAHHEALTRLLLERGADPNDPEAAYHSPETGDSDAMRALVETGRLTAENLALMLIRKLDWHDAAGVEYLLEHGADAHAPGWRGISPLRHALSRDNSLSIIELLLQHGADPRARVNGESGAALAARRGRGDVLAALTRRGISVELSGAVRLIEACARNDAAGISAIATGEPALVAELMPEAGRLLAEFAGTWNTAGVGHLLDLGVPVDALYEGDPYFDIAPGSTALHVAAWKGVTGTVRLLLDRGAAVGARDGAGRTPLMLAVKACVDSHWMDRRNPDTVRALLEAGGSAADVPWPSGYAEVDVLLRR